MHRKTLSYVDIRDAIRYSKNPQNRNQFFQHNLFSFLLKGSLLKFSVTCLFYIGHGDRHCLSLPIVSYLYCCLVIRKVWLKVRFAVNFYI